MNGTKPNSQINTTGENTVVALFLAAIGIIAVVGVVASVRYNIILGSAICFLVALCSFASSCVFASMSAEQLSVDNISVPDPITTSSQLPMNVNGGEYTATRAYRTNGAETVYMEQITRNGIPNPPRVIEYL